MWNNEIISKINTVKEIITFLPIKDQEAIVHILDKNLPPETMRLKMDKHIFYSENEKRGVRASITKTMQHYFSLRTKYVTGRGEEWYVTEKGKDVIVLSKKEFWAFLDSLPNWIINSLMELRNTPKSKTADLVVKANKKIIHTEIVQLSLVKFPQLKNYQNATS